LIPASLAIDDTIHLARRDGGLESWMYPRRRRFSLSTASLSDHEHGPPSSNTTLIGWFFQGPRCVRSSTATARLSRGDPDLSFVPARMVRAIPATACDSAAFAGDLQGKAPTAIRSCCFPGMASLPVSIENRPCLTLRALSGPIFFSRAAPAPPMSPMAGPFSASFHKKSRSSLRKDAHSHFQRGSRAGPTDPACLLYVYRPGTPPYPGHSTATYDTVALSVPPGFVGGGE